jgi:N-acetylmuramoyl-L-alanine amidase
LLREAARAVAWLLLRTIERRPASALENMGKTHRLKARLLREAVADNIATINGDVPKPLRRGRRFVARWGSRVTALLFVLTVVSAWRLLPAANAAAVVSSPAPAGPETAAEPARDAVALSRPERLSVSALALGIRRVVIDAGHGGTSLGTSAAMGLHEKDVTLDIAGRLERRLSGDGVSVLMTRSDDDTLSLQARSDIANTGHGDIFVSIHVNALGAGERGIETYYLGPSDTPAADVIAADENRESGYSMADLRTLVDQIYTDARTSESRLLAETVQHALLRDLRRVNPALTDRGVKTAPFIVLVGTHMPAILAEVSCLSDEDEAELLSGQRYRQSIADALFDGIHTYLRTHAPEGRKETRHGS